jgi:C1A family cysteine protease
MTSDTGCGSAFLDMNHCVQVVGYAFTTSSNNGDDGSRDNGGSRDGGKREGYWIVKNQWSNYWGMNGYAYLAMGENTCGILNDMTQVYM